MTPLLSYLYRLLLGAWVGAVLCFGAVVAPALFRTFSPPESGRVVREIIPVLDRYALLAAPLALLAAGVIEGSLEGRRARGRALLLGVLTATAAASAFGVTPRLAALRAASGERISSLPPGDPVRQEYGRLHGASTVLMGAGLLLGLAGLALPPRRRGR